MSEKTQQTIAHEYGLIPAEKFMPKKFHKKCLHLLKTHLKNGSTVADLGCGHGTMLSCLSETALDLHLYACDLSPQLAENAKKLVPTADVRVADIENLPFQENFFDAICTMEVLEHIPNLSKGLSQIRKVLKPGGWLLISLPNRDWFHFDKYVNQRTKFQPVDDHFYSVGELEQHLLQAGFVIRKIRGGENLYFGGGLPHLLEKIATSIYPRLQRRMKRMIFLSQKPF